MAGDMFFTQRKLELRIGELESLRYRDMIPMEEFFCCEDVSGEVNPDILWNIKDVTECNQMTAANNQDTTGSNQQTKVNNHDEARKLWNKIKVGENWSGRDRYLWLHTEIVIPDEWRGRKVLGIFDFGRTGGGNNNGFEALLYLNGKPYQGVDSNHMEVFFHEEDYGKTLQLDFRLWSGLEGGGIPVEQEHKLKKAGICWLDEKTDHLFYMGSMITETSEVLDDNSEDALSLKQALNQAMRCIDWSSPGSPLFYESICTAAKQLDESLLQLKKNSSVTVNCVGHTHIDMAWLWRLKHTKEKASRSFSTVLRLMEQYPEYIFLQTQPQLYEYVKQEFPELYEQIKEKIAEGRWEPDGGMWVEADCNLTSGESLTRQILLGARFLREEFGKEASYLWLPDVFGYSWALPQILKKAGIPMFMTTKISWNQYNRMPHDTFTWKGIDGSEVLTHFITTPEPYQDHSSFYTYNGNINPGAVKGIWDNYRDKDVNRELLISYGYGDGGGGVNRDMLEKRRCLDELPGLPHVKTSSAGEYFDKLKETFAQTDEYVHTWDGELYLEYHRGTYTSHAHNKRMNRKMELLYREAEWMTVMKGIFEQSYDRMEQEKLTDGWKHILTNQFHDIIPGSSIREVYEDTRMDYEWIEQNARETEQDFWRAVTSGTKDDYTVVNALNWERNELVMLPEMRDGSFFDSQKNTLRTQRTENGTLVEVTGIPSMGYEVITFVPEDSLTACENQDVRKKIPFFTEGYNIETPYYQVSFNEKGQMSRIYDKTYEREVLAEKMCGNVFQMFEDKPMRYDAWDIDLFYQEKMREITEITEYTVTRSGTLVLTVHLAWIYQNSSISQDIKFYAESRRIDFETKVDYHEQHQLLKVAFPVDIRSTYATYDIQYGNVRRPNHWNTSWDQARFESVAHRFADLSEHDYGVSLLNDCKYGYDIKDNVIRLSLLKAATHPDYVQDQGEHEFTYSLYPHAGDFVEGKTVQEAASLNVPVCVNHGMANLPYRSFLSIKETGAKEKVIPVEIDAIKKAEDGKGIIIRFHEYAGSRQKITLQTGFAMLSWQEADLQERPFGELYESSETKKDGISLVLKPYEIKTIYVSLPID